LYRNRANLTHLFAFCDLFSRRGSDRQLTMADQIPSLEDLKLLRVVDLKKYLVEFQLSTSGNKPELVQRLYEHYQQKEASSTADEAMQVDAPEDSGSVASEGSAPKEETEDTAVSGAVPKKETQKLSLQIKPPKAHPAGAPPVEDVQPAATRAERSPVKAASQPVTVSKKPIRCLFDS
jgi:uncharacterized membrane protein